MAKQIKTLDIYKDLLKTQKREKIFREVLVRNIASSVSLLTILNDCDFIHSVEAIRDLYKSAANELKCAIEDVQFTNKAKTHYTGEAFYTEIICII